MTLISQENSKQSFVSSSFPAKLKGAKAKVKSKVKGWMIPSNSAKLHPTLGNRNTSHSSNQKSLFEETEETFSERFELSSFESVGGWSFVSDVASLAKTPMSKVKISSNTELDEHSDCSTIDGSENFDYQRFCEDSLAEQELTAFEDGELFESASFESSLTDFRLTDSDDELRQLADFEEFDKEHGSEISDRTLSRDHVGSQIQTSLSFDIFSFNFKGVGDWISTVLKIASTLLAKGLSFNLSDMDIYKLLQHVAANLQLPPKCFVIKKENLALKRLQSLQPLSDQIPIQSFPAKELSDLKTIVSTTEPKIQLIKENVKDKKETEQLDEEKGENFSKIRLLQPDSTPIIAVNPNELTLGSSREKYLPFQEPECKIVSSVSIQNPKIESTSPQINEIELAKELPVKTKTIYKDSADDSSLQSLSSSEPDIIDLSPVPSVKISLRKRRGKSQQIQNFQEESEESRKDRKRALSSYQENACKHPCSESQKEKNKKVRSVKVEEFPEDRVQKKTLAEIGLSHNSESLFGISESDLEWAKFPEESELQKSATPDFTVECKKLMAENTAFWMQTEVIVFEIAASSPEEIDAERKISVDFTSDPERWSFESKEEIEEPLRKGCLRKTSNRKRYKSFKKLKKPRNIDSPEIQFEHLLEGLARKCEDYVAWSESGEELEAIAASFRSVFEQITKSNVENCNFRVCLLIRKILALRRDMCEVLSHSSGLVNEWMVIEEETQFVHQKDTWVRKSDGCKRRLHHVTRASKDLGIRLKKLEKEVKMKLPELVSSVGQIQFIRAKVMDIYTVFIDANFCISTLSPEEMAEKVGINDFDVATTWHSELDLQAFQDVLLSDIDILESYHDTIEDICCGLNNRFQKLRQKSSELNRKATQREHHGVHRRSLRIPKTKRR